MKVEPLRFESVSDIVPRTRGYRPRETVQGQARAGPVATANEVVSYPRQILRFRKSERMLHWAIAIPFTICYASALVLMFGFNLHSEGISRSVFSWIHRTSGACFILFPSLVLLKNIRDYRIHLHNIKHAWTWAFDDVKWLVLFGVAAIFRSIKLPHQGKFNAAEKINFIMTMCSYPVFVVTGVLIWLPGPVFLSWIIHVGFALVATPLMFGHIYMALVNPGTRAGLEGMLTGYVDREWARHHYHRWYHENFGHEDRAHGMKVNERQADVRQAMLRPVKIRCPHCTAEHVLSSWLTLLETAYEFQVFTCPTCGGDANKVAVILEPGEGDAILLSLQNAGVKHFAADESLEEEYPLEGGSVTPGDG
jgi:formate dehydrogenase subunit gamma